MSSVINTPELDWRRPNYDAIWAWRAAKLGRLRARPDFLPALLEFYRGHPEAFITDWGVTVDPRNVERGLPTVLPFVPWPKQIEWIRWVMERWRNSEPGLTEKSRDSGVSWLSVALACTLCLLHRGLVIGFGSRKSEYVDLHGALKSLFEKARMFLDHVPVEFKGGWTREQHAPHMRIIFPGTGSAVCGECGDGIGRGDRCSLYFIDESAFLERPQLTDASLSQTTRCRIDISTPNGRANSFAEKRFSGRVSVFTFSWRDDPRKDSAWRARQEAQLDPRTLAQEVDLDYSGSVEGVLLPSRWIERAVDAHLKLGIEPTGWYRAGLDVADAGVDFNALCARHGVLLTYIDEWTGRGSDLFATTQRAFEIADALKITNLIYDADGLGSGLRGMARVLNERRQESLDSSHPTQPIIAVTAFNGSGSVLNPDRQEVADRPNKDLFLNRKSQSWWALRKRFEATFNALQGLPYLEDDIISIPSALPLRDRLMVELSQPTWSINGAGKIQINKAPDGSRSPNLADSAMIAFSSPSWSLDQWIKLGGP